MKNDENIKIIAEGIRQIDAAKAAVGPGRAVRSVEYGAGKAVVVTHYTPTAGGGFADIQTKELGADDNV